jgi:hypothetical protein
MSPGLLSSDWHSLPLVSVQQCRPWQLPLSACGCKKFDIDSLGDHVSTCTTHSGVKKAHDWSVDQLANLFHTTHEAKTQQVSSSHMNVGEVALTLVLMDTYITLMILIGHLMRLPLTKLENIALIIKTIPLTLSPLCLLLLVRLGGYTVNLCVFYFYTLIGKLTAFCSFRSSASVIWLCPVPPPPDSLLLTSQV